MNKTFDFCIVITTYNRPDMLYKLLDNIELEKKDFNLKIFVFNDGSTLDYDLSRFDITHIKFFPNRGKKNYWEIVDTTFKVLKSINSNYFIYLPDDVTLCPNFFNVLKETYETIIDNRMICLSFLVDNRVTKSNWGSNKPINYGNYIKTGWNDLCFMSKKSFFNVLNFKIDEIPKNRWKFNENLSSGVGQQITEKLNKLNYNMYHTKKSLVNHGEHISVMNPKERIKNKLISR